MWVKQIGPEAYFLIYLFDLAGLRQPPLLHSWRYWFKQGAPVFCSLVHASNLHYAENHDACVVQSCLEVREGIVVPCCWGSVHFMSNIWTFQQAHDAYLSLSVQWLQHSDITSGGGWTTSDRQGQGCWASYWKAVLHIEPLDMLPPSSLCHHWCVHHQKKLVAWVGRNVTTGFMVTDDGLNMRVGPSTWASGTYTVWSTFSSSRMLCVWVLQGSPGLLRLTNFNISSRNASTPWVTSLAAQGIPFCCGRSRHWQACQCTTWLVTVPLTGTPPVTCWNTLIRELYIKMCLEE